MVWYYIHAPLLHSQASRNAFALPLRGFCPFSRLACVYISGRSLCGTRAYTDCDIDRYNLVKRSTALAQVMLKYRLAWYGMMRMLRIRAESMPISIFCTRSKASLTLRFGCQHTPARVGTLTMPRSSTSR